jgi:hypothetical protein
LVRTVAMTDRTERIVGPLVNRTILRGLVAVVVVGGTRKCDSIIRLEVDQSITPTADTSVVDSG